MDVKDVGRMGCGCEGWGVVVGRMGCGGRKDGVWW